jgi:surfactin synthase thioesterase subunit
MLLLPSAGGGPYSMSALVGQLPAEVRVLAASYPGRSGHPDDPPAERLDDIADGLAKAIGAPPAGGLAVFGHSLGAMIGLRLSRLIEQAGHRLLAFAPAGCPPPHRAPNDLHVLSTKDDSVLVSDLIRLGGLPPDLREDADILASVLAVIRGDFALTVDYPEPVIASRLSCPIVALGGEDDPATAPPVLPFWSEATEGGARVRVVPGGHFFHLEHPAEVTSAIAPYLHAPATAADSRLDPIAARR